MARKIIREHNPTNQIENSISAESEEMPAVVGVNEKFDALREFLAFNKTEWSEIFGVSRVTIYSWIKHEMEPLKENSEKIAAIFHLVKGIPNRNGGDAISRGYLIQPITRLQKSVYEIFKSPGEEILAIVDLSDILRGLSLMTQKNNDRMKRIPGGSKNSEWNLDNNLRNLSR
ncbi:MAG: hypothetical protein AB7S52_08650 [Sphaerochaetaceae bacterium]